jgi:serine/threonine-protein kinase
LIAEIGRGGMANVYLAVARGQAGFNKLVVIKRMRQDLELEGDVQAMFLDEARLAARMNHPNVVQTHEFGHDDGRYFIAMEYLDGQPYSRILSRLRGELPAELHVRVVVDTLVGLHHAHELRDFDGTPLFVVHRDATPHNVFVTYDGSIKVVDFGIAKALDSAAQTRTGVVKGKVTFMSPEQVRGEPLDRRTDVFAAGVMLWEALAGRRMWDELPELSVVHELMYDRVPALVAFAPATPPALLRVVARATAARRDDRYATALEMAKDLEGWLSTTGAHASARDVGEAVARAFEADRARVRAVIESQLHDLRWTGVQPRVTGELPSLDLPAGVLHAADVGPQPAPVVVASGAVVPTNGGAAVPLAPRAQVNPGSAGRALLVPALVAAAASIAVVLVGVRVLVRPTPAPTTVAPSSAPTAAPATPAAPATAASTAPTSTATPDLQPEAVTLTVRGRPDEVRIYLDGMLLSAGPFEGKVLRSASPRTLRIEAQGYQPKEQQITLERALVLAFDLAKIEAPKATGAAPRPAGPGPRGKHDIDADSPYRK